MTKFDRTSSVILVAQAVAMSTLVKQPTWLRVATVSSTVLTIASVNCTDNIKIKGAVTAFNLALTGCRAHNCSKHKQFKRELVVGGLNAIVGLGVGCYQIYREEKAKR